MLHTPSPKRKTLSTKSDERGMALLLVVVCSTLFMLLGLTLTFSSMTEFRTSTEFEAREKALLIADGGFNLTQAIQSKPGSHLMRWKTAGCDLAP